MEATLHKVRKRARSPGEVGNLHMKGKKTGESSPLVPFTKDSIIGDE